jgi:hypothetical protein
MHKRRYSKGRFVTSNIAENSRKTPHTNSTSVCVGEILIGESSKAVIETTAKGTKSETTVQIENIIQQTRRETLVTQSKGRVGKETKVVVEKDVYAIG